MNPPARATKKATALAAVQREVSRSREIIIAIGSVILGFLLGAN
jgi:hypothetical protein